MEKSITYEIPKNEDAHEQVCFAEDEEEGMGWELVEKSQLSFFDGKYLVTLKFKKIEV